MIKLVENRESQIVEKEKNMVETIKPPKNIRQMGTPAERIRIYLEDYVYTYLHVTQSAGENGCLPAILVGSSQESQGIRYVFISGAITIGLLQQENGRVIIGETIWGELYQELKDNFPTCSIVGWYYPDGEDYTEFFQEIERAHRVYFPGGDKVLYLNDVNEKEDSFYICNNGKFEKQKGYCIYYEKNPQMQEYMIMQKASQRIKEDREEIIVQQEVEDKAVLRYRAIVAGQIKKEERKDRAKGVLLGILSVAFICTLGIFLYTSYGKVEQLEHIVQVLTDTLGMEQERQQEIPVLKQEKELELPVRVTKQEPESEAAVYIKQGYYIVEEGDSLEKICRKIYRTVEMMDKICEKNKIEDENEIYLGQKLLLP
ncbi:MAG: LysM peptidoglycan-binding domain-containing protein [Lachnospiraceae bacterium]